VHRAPASLGAVSASPCHQSVPRPVYCRYPRVPPRKMSWLHLFLSYHVSFIESKYFRKKPSLKKQRMV
jgi:hypothetical protein